MNPGVTTYQRLGYYMNDLNSLHLSVVTDKPENTENYFPELLLGLNQVLITMPSTKQS